jgi:1-acyl-sn-glycerol-3-phosphate acyltransferase
LFVCSALAWIRLMIAALRSLWLWLTSGLLMLLWALYLALVWLFDRTPLRRRTARCFRNLGRGFALITPWRVLVRGQERIDASQTYVVVCNHQSLTDIPVIAHVRLDAKWFGKAELFRLPVIGWMMRMAGDIPVVRSNKRDAAKALLHCSKVLRQHCSVVFFPEGTRSPDGQVLPFNDGPFQLAIRERVPVLPIAVEGSGEALPKNTWLFGRGRDIHVGILEPVPVDGWTVDRVSELREVVRGRIVDEVNRLRQQ